MLKVYALLIIMSVLGGIAYGAKYYYDTTQNTIATLRENNVQLQVAAETAQESINTLQADNKRLNALTNQLTLDLQKAESYGDELRAKLSKLNLVVEALRDSKDLEGRMNGATAKVWRGFMDDTGNSDNYDLPSWLQQDNSRTTDTDSNTDTENNNTSSSETETGTTN